jgi:hypothetical protein
MQDAPDISSPSDGPGSSSVHSSDDRRTRRKLRRVRLSATETRSAPIDKGTISGISRGPCRRDVCRGQPNGNRSQRNAERCECAGGFVH